MTKLFSGLIIGLFAGYLLGSWGNMWGVMVGLGIGYLVGSWDLYFGKPPEPLRGTYKHIDNENGEYDIE